MTVDLRDFIKAIDPGKSLKIENAVDRSYYIDFSSVRGGEIIEELIYDIDFLYPDQPTCALFTGHIGCGKSTELLRLKLELQHKGFHVVYFESSEDLELADVAICDILLAIARRVSQSLEGLTLAEPKKFKTLLRNVVNILTSDVTGIKFKIPGLDLDEIGISHQNEEFSLAFGIGEITMKTKSEAKLRDRLNQILAPQKASLIEAINEELLEPAIAKLKEIDQKGLVVIIDNLDRLDARKKNFGKPQPEYLFVDQAEYLQKLHCHLVYTIPLALKFANEYGNLTQKYPDEPKVLPMVSIRLPDGSDCQEGIALLKQMVLARAFPDKTQADRLQAISEIFDHEASLDYLCRMSGGHVRDLLKLLTDWIKKQRKLPLTLDQLQKVIESRRNEITIPISDDEWHLLRQVRQTKKVGGDIGYEILIRSRLVFEYRYDNKVWFDINPI
jgi:septum formation topological specificity factor MinE